MVNEISNKQRPWKKILSYVILVIIALAAGYGLHSLLNNSPALTRSSSQTSDNSANNARKTSSNPQSTLNETSSTPSGSSSSSSASSNKPGAQASTGTSYQVQIVSSSVSQGNLHIGDIVSGTTSGQCNLTATKAGQSQVQLATSTVKQDINDYDCGVFNIPTSSFPSTGTWTIVLTVTNNGGSGSSSVNVSI